MLDCFFESGLTAIAELEGAQSADGMMELHECQCVYLTGVGMGLTGGNLDASSSKMSLIGAEPTP